MSWRPTGADDDLHRVGERLDRVVGRLGGVPASTLEAVFAHWEDLVGARVAAHVQPRSLRAGVLVVTVDEPAWATEVRFLTASLLERIAEVAGAGPVTAVEVRVRA